MAVELFLVTSLLYLVPVLPVAGAIWFFGRRRVQWNYWDFALALLPLARLLGTKDAAAGSLKDA
jgi:drug/metabolite transporter (DMT)-like permease